MNKRKVFISYSHDSDLHKETVLQLSERLRSEGVETILDLYVEGSPEQGWPRWMLDQLDNADFVLVVCTQTYYRRFRGHEEPGRGKGADWEGALITQALYDARSRTLKFVPILLSDDGKEFIPEPLRSGTCYALTSSDEYERLYDFLLGQSGIQPSPVGALRTKARQVGVPLTFDGAQPSKARKIDIDRIVKYAPDELIGREMEVSRLADAWGKVERGENKRPHVLTFVALGGEGKTSLVAKWAAELAHQGWPGCDAVFAWSFYSQGTREQTTASSDLFLAAALTFFGDADMASSAQSVFDKGKRLAQIIGERRALLILDGLEPLQHGPASPTPGEFKDQGIAVLLKGLAAINLGLCVLTTRYSIPDLRAYWQTTAPEEKLARLSLSAGIGLLEKLGVKGMNGELAALVEDVKGHALSLNLLGSYLRDAHAGDVRKRDLVKLGEADAEQQGGRCFRVMDAYVRWFEAGGEKGEQALSMLRLVGLFDRPAAASCINELLSLPAVPGLNETLVGISGVKLNLLLSRLENAKLLTVIRDSAGSLLALDTHPFLREYFGRLFLLESPEAWQSGHRRLYKLLCATTPHPVNPSLGDLQPFYQAIAHGCCAGLQEEAFHKVYLKRIKQSDEGYSANRLGAFSSDLGAVACFFDRQWDEPSLLLTQPSRDWLLNEVAICLQALSRLAEARKPIQMALSSRIEQRAWKRAATIANNLSEIERAVGGVRQSVEWAEQSVKYARFNEEETATYSINVASLGDSLHQAGDSIGAMHRFREAETIQSRDVRSFRFLYSVPGLQYCDLILAPAELLAWKFVLGLQEKIDPFPLVGKCQEVCQRVLQTVQVMDDTKMPLLQTPFLQLSGDRAAFLACVLQRRPLDSFHFFFQEIVEGFRRAGQSKFLTLGLLARAWLSGLAGTRIGFNSAQSDLDEAWEIAEGGPMPLLLADIHLYRARLFGVPHLKAEGEQYPWQSPLADLVEARRLIEKHGYWRRKDELEDAEIAARRWSEGKS
ncbi:TIR and AAA domain-containing protein [Nevskia sp.]|uniref:TIR and AAA domain-containing protein n=1 Tax=Nevskia sp. TaxID=1929292 RepID=UPI0025CC9E35|nr:TIR and AAA domain-containing protein [Nevskia sp.]